MGGNEEIEHEVRKILQKYCNYGWGHHYILDSQFGGLVQELISLLRSASEVSDQELVNFLLQSRKYLSEQEKAEMMKREFIILKREKS